MTNQSQQALAEQAADIFLCDLFTLDPTISRRFSRRLRDERAELIRVKQRGGRRAVTPAGFRPAGRFSIARGERGRPSYSRHGIGAGVAFGGGSAVRGQGGGGMGDFVERDGAGVDHAGEGERIAY